jgi:hypothetical protein
MKAILSILAFLVIGSQVNAACLYEHPQTINEEFCDSQSVFIGKVLSEIHVPDSGRYLEGKNYLVEVKEVFKGNLPKTVTIFCENSSGRFPMTVGKTYIAFIYYDGRYQIDNCGNSGIVSERQEVIGAVRLLKKSKVETNK